MKATQTFISYVILYGASIALFLDVKSYSPNSSAVFVEDRATATIEDSLHPIRRPLPTRKLPMLNETGGLVVFMHIAKTGGTTIRNSFHNRKFPTVQVERAMKKHDIRKMTKKIQWYLSKENNNERKTLLLELHGSFGESIFQLHPYLHGWRSMAKANNKHVFVFTMLREPTAFHVSYFNFFRNPNCKADWCVKPLLNLTEENLVASMIPNHQCTFLARKKPKREIISQQYPVTALECESAYNLLQANIDWVGTTETLQNTTLPMLSFMLLGDAAKGRSFKVRNAITHREDIQSPLKRSELSAETLQHIHQASLLDWKLYERAAQDYRLDMWENFVG